MTLLYRLAISITLIKWFKVKIDSYTGRFPESHISGRTNTQTIHFPVSQFKRDRPTPVNYQWHRSTHKQKKKTHWTIAKYYKSIDRQ